MNSPMEKSDGGLPSGAISTGVFAPAPLGLAGRQRSRLADYLELSKARLSLLVLFVTAVGFCLGAEGPADLGGLLQVVIGTALVAFAANALNQYAERDFDRLMFRTANRPLPSGRVSPAEALSFSLISAAAGLACLSTLSHPLTALLAAVTLLLYVFVYTPLKRMTIRNTFVGAVAGAIPPLIGFAAARGSLDFTAWSLFAILFVWQMPHFFAIAWLYRDDYIRGGYKMLSVVDPEGTATARQLVLFSVMLLGVSLLPTLSAAPRALYVGGAIVSGLTLLVVAIGFAVRRSRVAARSMMLASIAYLPILMILLLLDRILA